jgi:general secretion pathway protein D
MTGGAGASPQTTTPVAASARPSTGGQIQADPATNSLIITAPEPQYRQMRQVIDQLDVRRAQVYVEALMVSVDAQKAADFGFQWQGLFAAGTSYVGGGTNFTPGNGNTGDNILNLSLGAAALNNNTSTGGTTAGGAAVASQLSLPSNGLNIGFVPKINGVYTLAALAHFLETNTGANVLATPNLVALDNEEAKIVVGQNIPLITGSYTNTGTTSAGTVNPFQTVERQDVGITLRIRSQIGENGTVRMTIYEENSSVQPNTSGQVTNKTSVETFVTVDDGAMIVLGGLIKDEYGENESGVPVLASIPVIGNLFKSTGRSRHKSNLMLFLRPIVLRNQGEADRLSVNRYDAIRSQQQSILPDHSYVMPVNDAPLVPPVKPDTRVDPSVPHDPATESLQLISPPPTPGDLLRQQPAPAPSQPMPAQQVPAQPAPPPRQ